MRKGHRDIFLFCYPFVFFVVQNGYVLRTRSVFLIIREDIIIEIVEIYKGL